MNFSASSKITVGNCNRSSEVAANYDLAAHAEGLLGLSYRHTIDLDVIAQQMHDLRNRGGSLQGHIVAAKKKGDDLSPDDLFGIPESFLTQLYHEVAVGSKGGSGAREKVAKLLRVIEESLLEVGYTQTEASNLVSSMRKDPLNLKRIVQERIKTIDSEKFAQYVGRIIPSPLFFRARERFDLNVPILHEIISRHRTLGISCDDYKLLDVGAWDGILSEKIAGYFDSIHMIEPNPLHAEIMFDTAQRIKESVGFSGRRIKVFSARVGLDSYLQDNDDRDISNFDVALLCHVLYFFKGDDLVELPKSLLRRLRPGGILIAGLNEIERIPGSRAHLRALSRAVSSDLDPDWVEAVLSQQNVEVTSARASLELTCKTPEGRQALKDIVTYLTPGSARYEHGFVDSFLERFCKRGNEYSFTHHSRFITVIGRSNPTVRSLKGVSETSLGELPVKEREEVLVPLPTSRKLDFQALLATSKKGTTTASTVVMARTSCEAYASFTKNEAFSISKLSAEEKRSFWSQLCREFAYRQWQEYTARGRKIEQVELGPLDWKRLRIATAAALDIVDFSRTDNQKQFSEVLSTFFALHPYSTIATSWRDIFFGKLPSDSLQSLLINPSEPRWEPMNHQTLTWFPASVEDDPEMDDLQVKSASPSITRNQEFAEKNDQLFERFDQVRKEMVDQARFIWRVQYPLIKALAFNYSFTPSVYPRGGTIESRWYDTNEEALRRNRDAALWRISSTIEVFNNRANQLDSTRFRAASELELEKKKNADFLSHLQVPVSYYLDHFDACVEELQQADESLKKEDSQGTISLLQKRGWVKSYGQTKEEMLQSIEKINGIHTSLKNIRKDIADLNSGLVFGIAKKYRKSGVYAGKNFEDLASDGILGLIRAINSFERHRGFRFSTYATWWVRQSITRELANAKLIRNPVHLAEYQIALAQLPNHLGRNPSTSDKVDFLREKFNLTEESAHFYVNEFSRTLRSLDKPISSKSGGDETSLAAMIPDKFKSGASRETAAEIQTLLGPALKHLTNRHRLILSLRFGIGFMQDPLTGEWGFNERFQRAEGRSLEQVAALLCITRERVRQIEEKAIQTLQTGQGEEILRLKDYGTGEMDIVRGTADLDPMAAPLASLKLNVRTVNALALTKPPILTINDLLSSSREEILSAPNVGEKTLLELKAALHAFGIECDWDDDPESFQEGE